MKHPCKKCLVKACCSQECRIWTAYISYAAIMITFISLIVGGALTVGLLLWLEGIAETTNKEWPRQIIFLLWLISFIVSTILQKYQDKEEQITIMARVVLGPMVMTWMVIVYSTKNYFKRG